MKENIYAPEGQEALTNHPEEKNDGNDDGNDEKQEWRKKSGLTSEMDIHVVYGYSHLGEKLLRITYNALGVKLTGTIQFCGGCA